RRVTGKGVHLVMTDSGWYRHRYFTRRGYRTNPVALGPGTSDPEVDANGHGTGESANALAVAPDAEFTMVKLNFVNPTASFNAAVALSPDIISNSWGWSTNGPLSAIQQAMAAAVATAVANGVVVVFSAGNGGFGFPGQHPDVISAGGVYMGPDGALRATEYASGFASQVYAGRKVPDVSGLVGDPPRAAYLMLPIPSGCEIDVDLGGTPHPAGDGTTDTDGWAAFSGTSAAAPQVAGACALIRQVCPGLAPAKVRRILRQTARDVTAGTNAMGEVAGPGYDLATGSGLVNANKAALRAKLQRLSDAAEAQDDPDALSAQDADELARLLAVADGSD
ncbi:MAG: S8 family serine peptidase, partial [Egibacteraceae bacterium]